MGKSEGKPYVICLFKDDISQWYALDRGYNRMQIDDDVYAACTLGDIVQSDTMNEPPYQYPAWATDLRGWVVLWFCYYD
jgi:hypothetical protein